MDYNFIRTRPLLHHLHCIRLHAAPRAGAHTSLLQIARACFQAGQPLRVVTGRWRQHRRQPASQTVQSQRCADRACIDRRIEVSLQTPQQLRSGQTSLGSMASPGFAMSPLAMSASMPVPLMLPSTCGSEAGSYLRCIDSCITQLKAQVPPRTCNESKEEEEEAHLRQEGGEPFREPPGQRSRGGEKEAMNLQGWGQHSAPDALWEERGAAP